MSFYSPFTSADAFRPSEYAGAADPQSSRPLSVSEAAKLLNDFLHDTPALKLCIRGEVSGLNRSVNGHFYFTLLDCTGQYADPIKIPKITCNIWQSVASQYRKETAALKNGQCVDIIGSFDFYGPYGKLNFIVSSIKLSGRGSVLENLERLRLKLQAEGLFKEERKKPLPGFIKTVGVATSNHGQAIKDIVRTLKNRAPRIKIVLAPCLCQGDKADLSIISALKLLEGRSDIDCIIVGRGGGSSAELQTYNSELLVRAVAACSKPVISAVGHEGDFSLCDLAADKRASTPTQAAEMLSDKDENLFKGLKHLQNKLVNACSRCLGDSGFRLQSQNNELLSKAAAKLNKEAVELKHLEKRLDSCMPLRKLEVKKQRLQGFRERLILSGKNGINAKRMRLDHAQSVFGAALRRLIPDLKNKLSLLQTQIEAVSPEKNFERGYAVVCDEYGPLQDRIGELSPGEAVDIYLKGGCLKAEVKEIILTDSPLTAFSQRAKNHNHA